MWKFADVLNGWSLIRKHELNWDFFSGFDGGSDDDTDDEELMKALEENVEIAKKVGECPVQHTERIKYKLIEKGAFFNFMVLLAFFKCDELATHF